MNPMKCCVLDDVIWIGNVYAMVPIDDLYLMFFAVANHIKQDSIFEVSMAAFQSFSDSSFTQSNLIGLTSS